MNFMNLCGCDCLSLCFWCKSDLTFQNIFYFSNGRLLSWGRADPWECFLDTILTKTIMHSCSTSVLSDLTKTDECNLTQCWLTKPKQVPQWGQGEVISWEMNGGAPLLPMSSQRRELKLEDGVKTMVDIYQGRHTKFNKDKVTQK